MARSLSTLNPDLLRGRPPRRHPDLDLVHIACLVALGATVVAMLLLRPKAPLRPVAAPHECKSMARGGRKKKRPQRQEKHHGPAEVIVRLVVATGRTGLRDVAEGRQAALSDAQRRAQGWKAACEAAREEGRDLSQRLAQAEQQAQEAGTALVRQVRAAEQARDEALKDCREECVELRQQANQAERERDEARLQLGNWRNRAICDHQARWEVEPLGTRPGGVEPPGTWLEGFAWFIWSVNNVDLNPATLPGRFLCDWSRDNRIGLLILTDEPRLVALDGYGAEPFAPLAESVLYQDGQRTVFSVSAGETVSDGEQTAQKWAYLVVGK